MFNTIKKYVGYYIVASILISLFVTSVLQPVLHTIVEGIIALAMFASILNMFLGDLGDGILLRFADWCVRCSFIAVITVSIFGSGWDKVLKLFNL
ncbi:MAG: hypothetical protein J6H31_05790 [Butyrivibrio sp.]|nr:hypothetical protein [Butyrivibrio sp.]